MGGITALHNAICAGHYDIVKFLVEFGCDVNAQDSDGWTPLHCAASCNNLEMVGFWSNTALAFSPLLCRTVKRPPKSARKKKKATEAASITCVISKKTWVL